MQNFYLELGNIVKAALMKNRRLVWYKEGPREDGFLDHLYSELYDIDMDEFTVITHAVLSKEVKEDEIPLFDEYIGNQLYYGCLPEMEVMSMLHLAGSLKAGHIRFVDKFGYAPYLTDAPAVFADDYGDCFQIYVQDGSEGAFYKTKKDELIKTLLGVTRNHRLDLIIDLSNIYAKGYISSFNFTETGLKQEEREAVYGALTLISYAESDKAWIWQPKYWEPMKDITGRPVPVEKIQETSIEPEQDHNAEICRDKKQITDQLAEFILSAAIAGMVVVMGAGYAGNMYLAKSTAALNRERAKITLELEQSQKEAKEAEKMKASDYAAFIENVYAIPVNGYIGEIYFGQRKGVMVYLKNQEDMEKLKKSYGEIGEISQCEEQGRLEAGEESLYKYTYYFKEA